MGKFEEKDILLLQQYLANELEGDAKAAFEERLEQDPALQEELELYQAIFSTIEEVEDQRLKKLLQDNPPQKNRGIIKAPWFRVAAMAASFLLIFALAYRYWPFSKEPIIQDSVFAVANFEGQLYSDGLLSSERNTFSLDSLSQKVANIAALYQAENYTDALALMQTLPDTSSNFYYQAQCQIALKQYKPAIQNLLLVEKDTASLFSNFCLPYLAYAYAESGNPNEARTYAEKALNNPGVVGKYKAIAEEVLGGL